jgi:hypothetical protein
LVQSGGADDDIGRQSVSGKSEPKRTALSSSSHDNTKPTPGSEPGGLQASSSAREDNALAPTPSTQKPWWKRFGLSLATLVFAPIVVGVAIWAVTQVLGPTLKPNSQSSSGSQTAHRGPEVLSSQHNLCARFKVAVHCTLNVVSSNSFMTLKAATNLKGVPTCSNNLTGFFKWADTHALPVTDILILNITSDSHALVEIEDLRVSIVTRSRPLRTTRIDCAGGAEDYLYSSIDLDRNPPKVVYYCNGRRCLAPNAILQKGGGMEFYIAAGSLKWLTHWHARIDLLVDGRLLTLDLGNYVSTPYLTTGGVDCYSGGNHWSCTRMPHS